MSGDKGLVGSRIPQHRRDKPSTGVESDLLLRSAVSRRRVHLFPTSQPPCFAIVLNMTGRPSNGRKESPCRSSCRRESVFGEGLPA